MDKAIGRLMQLSTSATRLSSRPPRSRTRDRPTTAGEKPPLPELSLHILDMRGNERESVSLGELVRVQVRMSEEGTYNYSRNSKLLVNPPEKNNCQTYRIPKSLESYLEAFAFTGSSTLELEAEVVTCLERCKPVLCQIPTGRREDDIETVTSFGRRRRRSTADAVPMPEYELRRSTLTKKLSVVAAEFGVGQQSQDISYAFPVTAPTTSGTTSLIC
ncbi:hypothetical protein HPB52_016252 [Rhipicephalus sanguineus]|uniref:Uncharacterized protein n=1 Tax=Rhipicephalus sanguineus TaxID=34632 RepID=A0A9D4PDF9_RHISA|nr:hypothetical protein HPB52_016252 [Rhipicephalus sanguineus]